MTSLPYAQPPSPLEDRTLPHQIVLRLDSTHSQALTVGCNCTGGVPIAAKTRWDSGEALAAWREFHRGQHEQAGALPDG